MNDENETTSVDPMSVIAAAAIADAQQSDIAAAEAEAQADVAATAAEGAAAAAVVASALADANAAQMIADHTARVSALEEKCETLWTELQTTKETLTSTQAALLTLTDSLSQTHPQSATRETEIAESVVEADRAVVVTSPEAEAKKRRLHRL